jgi:chromosome segregation ATPase
MIVSMLCTSCKPTPTLTTVEGGQVIKREPVTGWRICRLIPALVTLATCITGIALALVYKKSTLTVPFALGAGASLYLGYQSWEFGKLQSMEESARQLAARTEKLGEEILHLQDANSTYIEENAKLKESNKMLQDNLADLEAKLAALKAQIIALESENEKFAANNKEQRAQIDELQALVAQLQGTEKGFEMLLTDSTALEEVRKGNLGTLREQVEELAKTQLGYSSVLISLKDLLILFDEKVQKKLIASLHQQIDTLGVHIKGLEKVEGELDEKIKKLVIIRDTLQRAVNRLEDKIEDFGIQIGDMKGHVKVLGDHTDRLGKHVEAVTDAPPSQQL